MQEPSYVERQNFHPILYLSMLAMGVIGLLMTAPAADGSIASERSIAGFIMFGTAAIMVNIFAMTIRVLPDSIHVHFGRLIFFYSKTIYFDDIRDITCVDYRPLREAGGWGIRWGRHDGRSARYFNARGSRGVKLDLKDDKLFILGTEKPEALEAAIREAMAANS